MADLPQQPTNENNRYVIDLRTRFGSAFGESLARIAESALGFGYKVTPRIDGPGQRQSPFVIPSAQQEDEPEYYSPIGTPIYDKFTFKIDGGNYEFVLPPLVDLSIDKRDSVTSVNENDFDITNVTIGEVVESWGNAAWDITFRGILVDMVNHNRPLDQIKAISDMFRDNTIMEVSSRLFNAVGISKLRMKRLELPGMEGFKDTQPYIITARSYTDVELILKP